jgi:hypothetical protein
VRVSKLESCSAFNCIPNPLIFNLKVAKDLSSPHRSLGFMFLAPFLTALLLKAYAIYFCFNG